MSSVEPSDRSEIEMKLKWLLVLLLSLHPLCALAAAKNAVIAPPPVRVQGTPVASSQPVAGAGVDQQILSDLKAIATSVEAIKSKPPDYVPAYLAVAGALIGALTGGFVTWRTQSRALKSQSEQAQRSAEHARELAEARAKLEIGNNFVQWRLKQLSELYGPLHALLRQSSALYRLMNEVLVGAAPDRFRLRQGVPTDDFDGKVFEIALKDGEWEPFRTVLHLSSVYGLEYGIEDYFDELVAIGGRIVEVIEGKAGLAREDQDLMPVFGRYLAHYRVLKQLLVHAQPQKNGKDRSQASASPMSVERAAVFPKEIQGLVDDGYKKLVEELNAWRAKAGYE